MCDEVANYKECTVHILFADHRHYLTSQTRYNFKYSKTAKLKPVRGHFKSLWRIALRDLKNKDMSLKLRFSYSFFLIIWFLNELLKFSTCAYISKCCIKTDFSVNSIPHEHFGIPCYHSQFLYLKKKNPKYWCGGGSVDERVEYEVLDFRIK